MMMRLVSVCLVALVSLGAPAFAQEETLADIRQELSVLFVSIQRLKQELSTTGGTIAIAGGESVLERVDLIEGELERLTALTERLQNRIERIVEDGTNRIGDLEFRLVELEGGDISTLGETSTLGGDDGTQTPAIAVPVEPQDPAMAVGEQVDFDQAMALFENADFQAAAVQFTVFTETYPVGPLTGEAHYFRGEALTALGDTANAARAYLESFSGSPDNLRAADALLQLGLSLADLGQNNEACIALQQVPVRYPNSTAAPDAEVAATNMNCR